MSALAGAAQSREPRWIDARPKGGKEWKARETRTLADVPLGDAAVAAQTRFGGLAAEPRTKTGFFRVEEVNGRWWIIDPEGGRFVFNGVASVRPYSRFGAKEVFARRFGSNERWAEQTLDQFRDLGIRGIGGFSDYRTLRHVPKPMPYTVTLNLMSGFGRKLGLTHPQPGHTGYEDDCLPVFDPDFPRYCATVCREQLGAMKDDPWLVGCFSDNEMPIARDMLDRMLKMDGRRESLKPMRDGAEEWLSKRGVPPAKITDADRKAFVEHVYETYFRITTSAIRAALPYHLCLGSRFHGPAVACEPVWRAAGRWCDVISINYYNVWTPKTGHLRDWYAWSGKPCLITEFYAKGADSGMANSSGAGWEVKTQADRGAFYQNFTLALLESKTCVGWHWFKYMDNDPADSSSDPSNTDSNKGMYNIRYEPYQPLLDSMRELNGKVYPLIRHFDRLGP
ncbi:MAG: hypothetical protein ACO3JG_16330 [Luteolibacter sp.]